MKQLGPSRRRSQHQENVRIAVTLPAVIADVLQRAAHAGAVSNQSELARSAVVSYLHKSIDETNRLTPYAQALMMDADLLPSGNSAIGWSASVPLVAPAGETDAEPKSKRISFVVTKAFQDEIYTRAQAEQRSVASLVRRAIEWYLFEQVTHQLHITVPT